jgi:fructose-bisphosphate aldolase class II
MREHIETAVKAKTAIGHFNACTIDGIWAIADAAKTMNLPVIVGVSEGERDYIGVKQAAAILRSIREERNQPIFLNADHTYSFDRVKEAVEAGFDSVIFDGAKLSLKENIELTKKCADYARNRGILMEGELGFIGAASKVLDEIPTDAAVNQDQITKIEDAERFVRETGVDFLAPAVGNIHGMIIGGDPALNINRIKALREAVKIPLVLHGASGNSTGDIRAAIKAGIAIVHVNTELRLAYHSELMKSLSDNHEEIAAYKYLKPAKLAMQKVVEEKLMIISQS